MPNKIQRMRISSGAIAAGGGATAYSKVVRGKILCVHVNYPANNCTVDIDTDGEFKAQKILNLAAANTDAVYYPRTYCQDETGTDLLYAATGTKIPTEFTVIGRLLLTIASGTEGQEVSVDVIYEEY